MTFDPYNRTHELNAATTSAIATRLERRGEDPFFVQMLDDYLDFRVGDATSLGDLAGHLDKVCRSAAPQRPCPLLARHPDDAAGHGHC
jgi:hypothetical protein